MTTTVHLIHGIRNTAESPVKGLIPYLQSAGFQVKYPDYGYEYELETRFVNPMLVGALLPYIGPGDICVCHSNGCALAYELMKRGAPFAGAVFIDGALEQDIARIYPVEWIDVYFNSGDDITEVAKLGAELGVTDKIWGPLGHAGYVGADPEIQNVNCGLTKGLPVVSGHSDFFTPAKLSAWAPYLIDSIQAHAARKLHSEAYA